MCPLTVLLHQVDHIIGRQHNGSDDVQNLCLACIRCNLKKGPNIASIDPHTSILSALVHRLDTFVLLLMTAWEQLLKAELDRKDPGSILTGAKSAFARPLTITVTQAIDHLIPDRHDPVRKNLEILKDLRDGAAHLLVPEVTGIATRYFQASILNFIERFSQIAEEPPFRFEGTGLLTLGVAYATPSPEILRARYGSVSEEVKALIASLEAGASAASDRRFAVAIHYGLVLEKKPGPNAIRLTSSADGTPLNIVKVPEDPRKTCPHTTTQCAALLSEKTAHKWSVSAVAAVAEFLGVKAEDNQYHYGYRHGKGEYHSYPDRFVNRVVQRFRQDPDLARTSREANRSKSKPNATANVAGTGKSHQPRFDPTPAAAHVVHPHTRRSAEQKRTP